MVQKDLKVAVIRCTLEAHGEVDLHLLAGLGIRKKPPPLVKTAP